MGDKTVGGVGKVIVERNLRRRPLLSRQFRGGRIPTFPRPAIERVRAEQTRGGPASRGLCAHWPKRSKKGMGRVLHCFHFSAKAGMAFFKREATVSEGSAPSLIHFWMDSAFRWVSFVRGL